MNTESNFQVGENYLLDGNSTEHFTAKFKGYEPECDGNVTLAVFTVNMDGSDLCIDCTNTIKYWSIQAA